MRRIQISLKISRIFDNLLSKGLLLRMKPIIAKLYIVKISICKAGISFISSKIIAKSNLLRVNIIGCIRLIWLIIATPSYKDPILLFKFSSLSFLKFFVKIIAYRIGNAITMILKIRVVTDDTLSLLVDIFSYKIIIKQPYFLNID